MYSCGRKAGRGKGGECNNEINKKKNRFEKCHVAPGMRPQKSHLTPEVDVANEIICEHV
jgi:hypothetical protein